jgi:hypothetical protein
MKALRRERRRILRFNPHLRFLRDEIVIVLSL